MSANIIKQADSEANPSEKKDRIEEITGEKPEKDVVYIDQGFR